MSYIAPPAATDLGISLEAALACTSLTEVLAFAAFVVPGPVESASEETRSFSCPPTVPVQAAL